MKLIKINTLALFFGTFVLIWATGCTPEDENLSLGTKAEAAFTVTDISSAEMRNTYILESTTEGAFSYKWDLGNGEVVVGDKIDTAYYEEKGTYSITLTALSAGGHSTVSKDVTVEEDAVTGTNAVTGGDMEDESAWTFISTGSTETAHNFSDGAVTFTNDNPAQSNIGMWQAVELKGGRAYQFKADVKGVGMTNSWLEVLVLSEEPEEGVDPAGSAITGFNTWTGCGVDPFDGALSDFSCLGEGRTNIAEDGTYYLFIKAGSWDGYLGDGGLTIDNIQLIAQPRLVEGANVLEGSDMEDESVWTVTNVGLALTGVEFTDGVMKFSNGTASTQTNVGVWQAVDVKAGQIYKFKANVDDPGSTGSWTEFYVSATEPADGVDYTTGRIYPGDTKSFDTAGTVYVVVKVGSWDGNLGADGVSVDDVQLVEMN